MTCAKKIVECWIQAKDGTIFYGSNDCDKPQVKCPRIGNEGYEKCKTICQQQGHAEEMALADAGEHDLNGATAYMFGTTHFCENCQKALFGAGVRYLTKGEPYGL